MANACGVPSHVIFQSCRARHPFDVNRLDVLFPDHKVERSICLIEQRLCLQRFKADDFEATRTANAKLRPKKVYRRGLGGNVELLVWLELILTLRQHLCKSGLL